MYKITEIVFILDKSASMAGLEEETITGYNELLYKQKKEMSYALLTTVLFNHAYKIIHNRTDIRNVRKLSNEDYSVFGTTALLDAIGTTIDRITKAQKLDYRREVEKTIFVIITDGCENSSREYSLKAIKAKIKAKQEKEKWTFLFLGANIDAIDVASSVGIDSDFATNFCADKTGVKLNYDTLSDTMSHYRENDSIDANWKQEIDDYLTKELKKK